MYICISYIYTYRMISNGSSNALNLYKRKPICQICMLCNLCYRNYIKSKIVCSKIYFSNSFFLFLSFLVVASSFSSFFVLLLILLYTLNIKNIITYTTNPFSVPLNFFLFFIYLRFCLHIKFTLRHRYTYYS